MTTQEERVTILEQKLAVFQKETATHIRETEENTTIMLGVIRSQGQDIRRIFERLETIETKLDKHTALLTQILARLPEKP